MQRTIHSDNWWQASDLPEEGRTLTIDKVEPQEIAPDVLKSVVFFREDQKGLVLNQNNMSTIAHNTRIPVERWEQWKGYQITLYPTTILVKDEITPCIRIKFEVNRVANKV